MSTDEKRRIAAEAIERFLTQCVAHVERRFWISRVYDALLHFELVEPGELSIPRALRQAPELAVVALYWAEEGIANRMPGREQVTKWHQEFRDAAIGRATAPQDPEGGFAP